MAAGIGGAFAWIVEMLTRETLGRERLERFIDPHPVTAAPDAERERGGDRKTERIA